MHLRLKYLSCINYEWVITYSFLGIFKIIILSEQNIYVMIIIIDDNQCTSSDIPYIFSHKLWFVIIAPDVKKTLNS